jgi:hypothetical protein
MLYASTARISALSGNVLGGAGLADTPAVSNSVNFASTEFASLYFQSREDR